MTTVTATFATWRDEIVAELEAAEAALAAAIAVQDAAETERAVAINTRAEALARIRKIGTGVPTSIACRIPGFEDGVRKFGGLCAQTREAIAGHRHDIADLRAGLATIDRLLAPEPAPEPEPETEDAV